MFPSPKIRVFAVIFIVLAIFLQELPVMARVIKPVRFKGREKNNVPRAYASCPEISKPEDEIQTYCVEVLGMREGNIFARTLTSTLSSETAPGHSPGVGHRFNKDDQAGVDPAKSTVKSHDASFEAYQGDDFQPTDPGHSPGVGHSSHNTIVEPVA